MNHVICVHVGERYSNDYVEKLYRGLKRHSSQPFTFTVLHDGKTYAGSEHMRMIAVESYPFLHRNNLWWYKMQAFRNDVVLPGSNMLIDIDTVIVGSTDKLWDYQPDKFVIIQDFNRQFNPAYSRSNSSVIKFTEGLARKIDMKWREDPVHWARKYRGDQDWFDGELKDMIRWPNPWIRSWKWEVYRGGQLHTHKQEYRREDTVLDLQCSILAFHGKPDPHEVHDDIITKHWI